MNKEDKLILGTLAGVDLVLSPEHYEEYKGTLNKQLEQKDKEINRLNNIINEAKEYLKYQVENLDFEKDTKAKMLGSMILVMLDKEELKENK